MKSITFLGLYAFVLQVFIVAGYTFDMSILQDHWEHVHYLRTIDLSKSYVKETDLMEIRNVDSVPHNEYYFFVNDGIESVPDISIIAISLTEQGIDVEPERYSEKIYKITFPIPIAPNSSIEMKVRYVFTGVLHPYPEKINMDDSQTVLLKLNKYPFTPYKTNDYTLVFTGITKGQEMDLNLAKHQNLTNLPDLRPRVEDKALKYGPLFEELQPFTIHPMGLLYEHNRPITKVSNLERSIWIPASGVDQITFEEYYELTNEGAQLLHGFSRVDYMMGRYDQTRNHFSLSHLEIPIVNNHEFKDYYYSDKVGVVSTHNKIANHLVLQPRYPLFGGWKYNFTLGWSEDLSGALHKVFETTDTYIASVPLLNTVRDVYYDNAYVSFYLPENAQFVNVSSPIEFELISLSDELSYLDVSKGHVKVTLHFKNLIDDISKIDVLLMYKYTALNYWTKVFKISGFVFIALVSYYLISLIDISIENAK